VLQEESMTDAQMAQVERNIVSLETPADIRLAKMLISELRHLQATVLAACCIVRHVRVG